MDVKPIVFIVDDDEAVRKATSILVRSAGFDVECYGSAQEFLDSYRPERPGCLVLDVRMPEMNGLELQGKLTKEGLRIPIIIITGHGDVSMAVRAVKDGAVDFIEKPFDGQVLLERIEHAIKLDAEARRKESDQANIAARLTQLTPREREVMDLLVDGKSSKQIAYEFDLSRKTVDIHRAHIMLKLGIDSLADLVRIGLSQKSKPEE